MTELQIGLIGLGALGVIGVMAYNEWQEVRQRKLAEQVLDARHPDVLLDELTDQEALPPEIENSAPVSPAVMDEPRAAAHPPMGERIEPVLFLDPEPEDLQTSLETALQPEPVEADISQETAEYVANSGLPKISSEVAPAAVREQPVRDAEASAASFLLSSLIDFIASIDTVEPAPSERILEAQREIQSRVRKPLRWIGYNEESGEWETISGKKIAEYRHIRVGLQLVNRQGPASDNDLAVFSIAMQDLADQLMGLLDLPHRQPALEAAAKLDEFCAGVDIQIGINLISQGQVFPGTKLRALAEAAGMTIDAGQRFVRRDEDGNVLYLLLNQEASGFSPEMMKTMSTHGVTFLLDVPCVAHGERVFNQMVDLARRFADVLHGTLVDDNRRPLSENALEPIRKQIGQYQALMAAQHVPAGSPLAQRLFS